MKWNPRLKQALLNSKDGHFLVRRGLARGLYVEGVYPHGLRTCFGFYERELIPYLRSLIRVGDCCYDIGASNGYYTFLCGKLARGRVYAFESDAASLRGLTSTLRHNHLDPAHYTFVQAFVDKDTSTGEGTLALDDFVRQGHPPPDFVKMDIEGGEYHALLGLRRTLSERPVRLVIETHGEDVEAQCIQLLESLHYRVTIVNMAKYFQEARPSFHNRWIAVEPPRAT